MESNVRSSNEQQKDFRDTISEEINDMFACQEPGYREVFTEYELEEAGMYILEYEL